MTPADTQARETLDLLCQLVANLSDRLDAQATALDRLAQAQEAALASPGHVADATSRATAQAVHEVFLPDMRKLVDVMENLTGKKEVLQERLRAIRRHDKMKREEAGQGRWRSRPVALAVIVGIPLLLVTVLALTVPRAAAHASLTCRASGGIWSPATERFLSGCTYSADRRATASGS